MGVRGFGESQRRSTIGTRLRSKQGRRTRPRRDQGSSPFTAANQSGVGEEVAQHAAGLLLANPAEHFGAVVAGRLREQPRRRGPRRRPWHPRRRNEPRDPRQRDRRRAHRAGLEPDPQRRTRRAATCRAPRRRRANRDHFGMGGRIERSAHRVARLGDDRRRRASPPRRPALRPRSGCGGKVERTAHRRGQRKAIVIAGCVSRARPSSDSVALIGRGWLAALASAGRRRRIDLRPPGDLDSWTATSAWCRPRPIRSRLRTSGVWPPLARSTPSVGAHHVGSLAGAGLVDVDEARSRHRDDQRDHGQDQDEENGAHGSTFLIDHRLLHTSMSVADINAAKHAKLPLRPPIG